MYIIHAIQHYFIVIITDTFPLLFIQITTLFTFANANCRAKPGATCLALDEQSKCQGICEWAGASPASGLQTATPSSGRVDQGFIGGTTTPPGQCAVQSEPESPGIGKKTDPFTKLKNKEKQLIPIRVL